VSTVDALQATVAAEDAALYLFGVLGGRTSASAAPALYAAVRDAYATHRERRDALTATLRGLGVRPVAAEPAYELPGPAGTAQEIAAVGLLVEQRCAATYADLVANAVGDQRRWAIAALTDAALRALAFGGAPLPFPGMDELADG
jgi:hypothetical protein